MSGEPETTTKPHFHLTDVGNAERFALQHRDWARFCWPWRSWLLWTGTYWRRDDGDGALRLATATAKAIYEEAAGAPSPEERERLARWAVKSESEKGLRAMLALAQAEPGIPVLPEQLDQDLWALNLENGTVDLRPGEIRPHRREDLITKLVPVAYDPRAECPLWCATLARILDGRQELIDYLQKAIGYSLTGITTEQVIFVLWGVGANGKTTILTTAVTMLGDYALTTRPETFMLKRGESIPNDVAQLKGRRLVIAVEADPGQRLAEGLVKQMTGSDTLTARFMRAEFFQFEPTFKIFLATNHRPVIRGTDHAIWRRIRLLPFSVTIPDDEQDHGLLDKLRAERPGILRWAIEGCLRWQREGLGLPDDVRAATAEYQADMDLLGDFLSECCVLEPGARVSSGDLYARYTQWAKDAGETPITRKALASRLRERGIEKGKSGNRYWAGLRVRGPLEPVEPVDASGTWAHVGASSPISELRARVREQPGNKRPEAPNAQESLPDWVIETPPRPILGSSGGSPR